MPVGKKISAASCVLACRDEAEAVERAAVEERRNEWDGWWRPTRREARGAALGVGHRGSRHGGARRDPLPLPRGGPSLGAHGGGLSQPCVTLSAVAKRTGGTAWVSLYHLRRRRRPSPTASSLLHHQIRPGSSLLSHRIWGHEASGAEAEARRGRKRAAQRIASLSRGSVGEMGWVGPACRRARPWLCRHNRGSARRCRVFSGDVIKKVVPTCVSLKNCSHMCAIHRNLFVLHAIPSICSRNGVSDRHVK
jgi:hypothetical protein